MAGGLEWRLHELLRGEFEPAADRGAIGERARRLQDPQGKLLGRLEVSNRGPADHKLLRAETGPFDETHGDAPVLTGFDRVEHQRIRNGRRIALPLELELRTVDA